MAEQPRIASLERNTSESQISVTINLDGTGKADIETDNGMLKHMLDAFARHGAFDLTVNAAGDHSMGWHHVLEDTGSYIDSPERQVQIQTITRRELARSTSSPMRVTRHVPRQVRMFTTPTNIEFGEDEPNGRTVIDISTGDRPGLLSKIGQVFDSCEIRLQNARIATVGERAEDVFFVTDFNGKALANESVLEELRQKLLLQLEDETA